MAKATRTIDAADAEDQLSQSLKGAAALVRLLGETGLGASPEDMRTAIRTIGLMMDTAEESFERWQAAVRRMRPAQAEGGAL